MCRRPLADIRWVFCLCADGLLLISFFGNFDSATEHAHIARGKRKGEERGGGGGGSSMHYYPVRLQWAITWSEVTWRLTLRGMHDKHGSKLGSSDPQAQTFDVLEISKAQQC